jgi:hypothetical protein
VGELGIPASDRWKPWLGRLPTEALIQVRDDAIAELRLRDVCEHDVQDGDYCEPCNREYKRASEAYEKEIQSCDDF